MKYGRVALLLAIAMACDSNAPPLAIAIRFVDSEYRADAQSQPASLLTARPMRLFDRSPPLGVLSETIGNDTRLVLAAPRRETAVPKTSIDVSADGRLSLPVAINPALRNVGRIALIPSLRYQDAWSNLEQQLHRVPQSGVLEVDLDPPPHLTQGRRSVPVVVRAIAADPARSNVYHTPAVAIPAGALLDFSYGSLHPSPKQSDLRFSVAVCDGDACETVFERRLDSSAPGDVADADTGWRRHRIPLNRHAGTTRSFRFTAQRIDDDPDAYALPVWGNPTILAPREPVKNRSNLILVSIDTLRADHLGLYGYDRDTTPQLDRLAAERATVFDAFTAASTHTGPSHMTIFTSLPPSVHGVHGMFTTLAARVATMPELLRDRGYATAAFTGGGPLNPDIGFGRGFDLYVVDPDTAVEGTQIERMAEQARRWIGEHRERPFFLFLHSFQVHTPYDPPERYQSVFRDDEVEDQLTLSSLLDRRTIEQMANYDREIRHVDDTLGALFEWLETEQILDDTIVVILSDHGEEFREHGLMGHATLPYQSVLHVPLIVFSPGISTGSRVHSPVSHAGLMPTLLELLEIPAPQNIRGRSFANAFRGQSAAETTETVVSEAWTLPAGYQSPSIAIRSGNWKLIRTRSDDGEQIAVFDLGTNPGETRPASLADPQLKRLRAALVAYDDEVAKLQKALLDVIGGDARDSAGPSPEVEQKLRKLGYLE